MPPLELLVVPIRAYRASLIVHHPWGREQLLCTLICARKIPFASERLTSAPEAAFVRHIPIPLLHNHPPPPSRPGPLLRGRIERIDVRLDARLKILRLRASPPRSLRTWRRNSPLQHSPLERLSPRRRQPHQHLQPRIPASLPQRRRLPSRIVQRRMVRRRQEPGLDETRDGGPGGDLSLEELRLGCDWASEGLSFAVGLHHGLVRRGAERRGIVPGLDVSEVDVLKVIVLLEGRCTSCERTRKRVSLGKEFRHRIAFFFFSLVLLPSLSFFFDF
ncbi:hypothetical protein DFH27DRAFT_550352, partial [Peziza echinospora]